MCGLTGFITPGGFAADQAQALVRRMADTLVHRGPDSSGEWVDAESGVAIAHRRLSILDLSAAGHQPMVSQSGRYVIAFNGEIYNHLDLRRRLDDQAASGGATFESSRASASAQLPWRGHSDTETLLAGFEAWGIETTLTLAIGMFAFAIWDRAEQVLYLARDRMGEKPLYYGWQNGTLVFSSELKALKAHPAFSGEIDRDALTLLVQYGCIPSPYSIYKGISKLPPASLLRVNARALGSGRALKVTSAGPQPYWSLREVIAEAQAEPFQGDPVSALDTLLRDAVRQQMLADVPLGAFLSGGVDSSTIVALMQAQSSRPVKTFTIGFNEAAYSEAHHASAVAKHLNTDHTELYVSAKDTMEVIPRLPDLYDEPFADSSQIPTFLVSRLTRQHVTVSLSGDGGDEVFGGYTRYLLARRITGILAKLPRFLRSSLARLMHAVPPARWDAAFAMVRPILPSQALVSLPGGKAHKLAELLVSRSPSELYDNLVSTWKNSSGVVLGGTLPATVLNDATGWPPLPEFESRMMYLDSLFYLPDDILVKVDRAAMGVSLETRVPFLDQRVVEFAWRLPLSKKIQGNEGKWILRQVLYKYVPRELIQRPKMGFGLPIDSWLRGPLRNWAEALLAEPRLKHEGFFNPAPIRKKWHEHLSGRRNWQYALWNVLMFQLWLEANQ